MARRSIYKTGSLERYYEVADLVHKIEMAVLHGSVGRESGSRPMGYNQYSLYCDQATGEAAVEGLKKVWETLQVNPIRSENYYFD